MNNLDAFRNTHKKTPKHIITAQIEVAVIYNRVSTPKQERLNHSLDTQLNICEGWCKQNDVAILKKFGGTSESAKTDDRKEFSKMLDFVIKNNTNKQSQFKIKHVVVSALDRFSRSGARGAMIIESLKDVGAELVAVDDNLDNNTSHGKFFQGVKLMYNEYENNIRRDKIILGTKNMLMNGGWPTKAPLGYSKILDEGSRYKKSVINPTGELIEKAFRLKLEGQTNTYIQKWLKLYGLNLRPQKLCDIFKNPFYCGVNKHALLDYEPVIGNQEIMLTQEEFIKINNINAKYLKTHKTDDDFFPLKSSLICDICGSKMTAYHIIGKNAKYYKCNKLCKVNFNAHKMHILFKQYLDMFNLNEMYTAPLMLQLKYTFDKQNHRQKIESQELAKHMTRLKNEMEKIDERFATGDIEKELHHKVHGKKTLEYAEMEKEYNKLNYKLSNLDYFIRLSLKLCSNLSVLWENSTLSIQQRLQNLMFPKGIRFNKEIPNYRTIETNRFFTLITSLSNIITNKKTGETSIETGLSGSVVPTRIELISRV